MLRLAWFPILFLGLAIPLPETIYVSLSMPLRKLASWTAAGILPLLVSDLWIEAQAVVIDWMMPDGRRGQLNVEDACSGMRSLMAIVTLGVAMAYLDERPWWHRVVMVLSCLPIAVCCNVIRVTTTGLLHIGGHEEWASGTPHLILGFLTFAIALGLYALVGYVLNHLVVEEHAGGGKSGTDPVGEVAP
jgi:exosortase